ncbi:hypothetical protein BE04_07225 [Sorangium cellulosum]|uniref:Uncharacterized protein n=1 Tax=Sorangium cellulosum TaxID=56 RepID=A0A150P5C9_SORCE|nr:hypothetical protein BE04_07225 [Sorangium cellulosum]
MKSDFGNDDVLHVVVLSSKSPVAGTYFRDVVTRLAKRSRVIRFAASASSHLHSSRLVAGSSTAVRWP